MLDSCWSHEQVMLTWPLQSPLPLRAMRAVPPVAALQQDGQPYELFSSIRAAGFQSNMLAVWHAVRWFQACFAGGRPHAMPPALLGLLECIKTRCEEELVLAEGAAVCREASVLSLAHVQRVADSRWQLSPACCQQLPNVRTCQCQGTVVRCQVLVEGSRR